MFVRGLLVVLAAGFFSFAAAAQTGSIRGKVTDANTGEGLIGAAVVIEGTIKGASADLDGNFSIENVQPGTYTLVCQYISYTQRKISDVVVQAGKATVIDFAMAEAAVDLGLEVEISAKANRAAENYLLTMQKKSATVLDGISSQQIRRGGDSDAAGAVKRVTGVSVEGGKYVYVRGLSDRYSLTTLNGAQVPSLDPQRNSVQLDLFPTNLVDNILVVKTFTPEYPGNWAGGLVNIVTKDFPENFTLQFNTSLGYNENVTFNDDYISASRGGSDLLGFDDGSRDIPEEVENVDIRPVDQGSFAVALNFNGYNDPETGLPFEEGRIGTGPNQISLNEIIDFYPELESQANVRSLLNEYRIVANEDLTNQTRSFDNTWQNQRRAAPLNQSYGFSVGNQTKFLGRALGFNVGLNYSYSNSGYTEDGFTGRYKLTGNVATTNNLNTETSLRDIRGNESVLWGGLANFNYKLNSNHVIGFVFMHNQSGENSSRYQIGENQSDQVGLGQEQRVQQYLERSLSTGQLKGSHYLPGLHAARVEWSGSYTKSIQNTPDLRFMVNSFEVEEIREYFDAEGNDITEDVEELIAEGENPAIDYPGYTRQDRIDTAYSVRENLYPIPARFYRTMDEDNLDAQVNVELPINGESTSPNKIKFGAAYLFKDRVLGERRFDFRSTSTNLYDGDPDVYFSEVNTLVQPGGENAYIYVIDGTVLNNSYVGDQQVVAGYAMTDLELTKKLRMVGGLRVETTDIFVESVGFRESNLSDEEKERLQGNIDELDLLPALSFTYALTDKMNLRLAGSRTLARPTFREFGPFGSFDFEFQQIIVGNPQLERTLIWNGDVRWEFFPNPGEIFSVSAFGKSFTNPIERILNPVSANVEITYDNLESSYLYGVEIEGRKQFLQVGESRFVAGANVSFIEAFSNIREDELEAIRAADPGASDTRDMFGQSPYIVNANLTFSQARLKFDVSLSYNVQGPRLILVNRGATPDIYDQPRNQLDLVIGKDLGKHFNIGFRAANLFDAEYQHTYTYRDVDYFFQRYRLGRTYSLSLRYKI